MFKILFPVFVVICTLSLTEAQVCKSDSECGSNECCYIEPEFLVASKRQVVLPPVGHVHHDTGVCEAYRSHSDQCGLLETMNGHCGCAGGMTCQWVPDPTTPTPIVRRRPIAHNEPGAYRCA